MLREGDKILSYVSTYIILYGASACEKIRTTECFLDLCDSNIYTSQHFISFFFHNKNKSPICICFLCRNFKLKIIHDKQNIHIHP